MSSSLDMGKKTKDEWVNDNLFTFHMALESLHQRGLICPICHNGSGWGVPYEQPTDERIRILCGRCGYVMDFHEASFDRFLVESTTTKRN